MRDDIIDRLLHVNDIAAKHDAILHIKRLRDEVGRLRDVITEISRWTEDTRSYDEDMGHEPRGCDEEMVGAIEAFARAALAGKENDG